MYKPGGEMAFKHRGFSYDMYAWMYFINFTPNKTCMKGSDKKKIGKFTLSGEEKLIELKKLIGFGDLTLSHKTNFGRFQTERVCGLQFQIANENSRKILQMCRKRCGKRGIARYDQFLLFPHGFRKTCTADT